MLLILREGKFELDEAMDATSALKQYEKILKKDFILLMKKLKELDYNCLRMFKAWKMADNGDNDTNIDDCVENVTERMLQILDMAKTQVNTMKVYLKSLEKSDHIDKNTQFVVKNFLKSRV